MLNTGCSVPIAVIWYLSTSAGKVATLFGNLEELENLYGFPEFKNVTFMFPI